MFEAFHRAARQLSDPWFRRILLKGIAAAIAIFVVLWMAIAVALVQTSFVPWAPVEIVLDVLGGAAAVVIALLLFPASVGIAIGVLLEDVTGAVEARYYPGLGPPRSPSLVENLIVALRFSGVLIVLNLIVLPLYLIPGLNLALYTVLNGYLLGREYFELVALRRL